MPESFQVTRHVCHAPSIGVGCVANDVPSDRAWTVVPDGQSSLPYHSARSISPPTTGWSFDNHQAGQHPSVRQLNLIRASQVVLMPPHHVPCSLPLTYLPLFLVARMTRLEWPSRNTCWRSSRYCPMFSGLSQNTGFLIVSRAFATIHFDGSGAEPAGPSNSSWNRNPGVCALGGGAVDGGSGPAGPSGRNGSAPATGTGIAEANRPIPVMSIMLRRLVLGTAVNDKAERQTVRRPRLATRRVPREVLIRALAVQLGSGHQDNEMTARHYHTRIQSMRMAAG